MTPAHPGNLLHGLDARTQRRRAPGIQELPGPSGRLVGPQLLEVFLQQIGADAFEVIAEQLFESPLLGGGEILGALQEAPAGLLQHRLAALAGQCPRLLGAHVVQGVIHLGDDVKPIQDVDGLGTALPDHADIGPPHVRADEFDARAGLRPQHGEEPLEGLHGALLTHPQETHHAGLDLVDQGQIFVPPAIGDLIDPEGLDGPQDPMLEPPAHDPLDRPVDVVPGGVKRPGDLQPREFPRPMGEKLHVGHRQMMLTLGPGQELCCDPTRRTIHPATGIPKEHRKPPEGDKLKGPLRELVITGAALPAARAIRL